MSESVWKFMRENEIKISCEVSKELQCKICNKLMIKACHAPCGCRFCSDCIQHHLDGNDKFCPGTSRYCQNRMINYANDIAIDWPFNIRISEIVVNCPRQNCEFNDELQMIENHMRTCDKRSISCPFNAIGCGTNEIRNEEMKSHLNEEIYSHSKLLIELINNLRNEMESMKSENTEMRNYNIELRNDIIELRNANKQFKQQIDNIERQLINQQQKMCEMEAKEQENTGEIELLNEEMVVIKNANRALQDEMIELRNDNIQLKREISQSRQQNQNIELQLTNQQQKMCEMEAKEQENRGEINEEIAAVNNANRALQNEMIELRKEISQSKQQIDAFKQISEQQQLQQNIKIQNEMEKCASEIRPIQTKFGNAEFINFGISDWQIDKLSQLEGGKSIYSEPFYSGPGGYKMCLAVAIISLFGDAIWVGFHLMRGDCDAGLEWPFKYAVKVDMINPADGNVYRSQSVKCPDSPAAADDAGWGRPARDRNDPICYYITDLSDIKNDKLLLKCRIEKL